MALHVIAELHAREGLADQLRESLKEGRDVALGTEGCETFEVFVGIDDPNRFYMVERWTSEDHHAKHFQANVAPDWEKYMRLLDEPLHHESIFHQAV